MDYGGHYRLLHYTAKKFFSPLLVSVDYNKDTNIAAVFLTSDINEPLAGTAVLEGPPLLVFTMNGLADACATG